MDIAGAKALKRRLGTNEADNASPAPTDVPDDAPPVYHWVGVSNAPADASFADAEEASTAERTSLFSRLGLRSSD